MTVETTPRVAEPAPEAKAEDEQPPTTQEEERPPQSEQLLCTICHMPSCWR
jgi:hypothetical protein